MRLTVSFFKVQKDKIDKLFNILKVMILVLSIIFLLVVFLLNIIKSEIGQNEIIGMANNITKKSEYEFSVNKIVSSYPVFNASNYILKEVEVKKAEEKEIDKTVKVSKDIPTFDVTVVDSINILNINKKQNLKVTSTSSYDRISIYGVSILNYSSNKSIKYEELFNSRISFIKKQDPILMYCTHTSETYTSSDRYKINYSGKFRIRDAGYNMLSVANVMAETLNEKNFNVTFDTTPHDYTSYQNAYKNSKKTIINNLKKSKYSMVIDIHRDASGDLSYGPTTEVNGNKVAKLMLVMGVGTKGYENEYWKENLSLAVKIMRVGESMYPGLFKPMIIRNSKYNQDLNKNSFLVEVGATGNTLEESHLAARCLANILNKIYE